MSYTLYGFEGNPRTRVCQVTAELEGVPVTLVDTNPYTKANQVSYVSKFPVSQGRVPALVGPNIELTESIAIASYLASLSDKAKLLGRSKEEAAEVLQWVSITNAHVLPMVSGWFRPLVPAFNTPYNKVAVAAAEKNANELLATIEAYLQTRTFFVGHRLTLADLFFASHLARGMEFVLDAPWRAAHPNIMRLFNTVVNQPAFLAVTGGKLTLIEKKVEYTPPKKEAKPAAAPAAAAPKAEKKKAEKKEKDDDDDEPAVPAEPKAKHPCEALGHAKCFPLDEWKRQYSNLDTDKALEWLKEHIDESEYTFWRVAYKYDDELTQVFMSSNLIGGFHNRLEASRKYLFGSMGVYGKTNASKIQGAYLIRGDDAKAVFEVAPDHESYSIARLDFKKDYDYIAGCFAWTNEYEGLPYSDGKVFK